jgi:hypothetical protein
MPEIEDYLASLEDDEAQEQQQPEVDPKKLGYALRQREKETKKLAKELEELRTWRADRERQDKESTLSGAGLSAGQAKAFLRLYEEVTPEAIQSFRTDILGMAPEPTPEPEPQAAPETPAPAGFAPTSTGTPVIAKHMLEAKDYRAMMKNPATRPDAIKAAREGRVLPNNPEALDVQVTDTAGLFRQS